MDARLWVILTYVAVALGCVLRVLRFVDNPALWLDEALLAINLTERSFSGILGPLDFVQSAAPGFLLVEKAAETIVGDGEYSLRLFPLLASLASVLLFSLIARRVLVPPAAAFAIVFFATGEPLLERAAEVKPYSVDVAVATLLIALTIWVLDAPLGNPVRRVAVLGVVGISLVWFSFPAVFTLAAAVAAVGLCAWQIRSWRLLSAIAIVGVAVLATFGVVYAVASSNVSLVSSAIFGGAQGDAATERLKIAQGMWSVFVNPLGFDNGTNALAALLACFGVLAFARRESLDRLALFALPALLAIAAELLGRYPLGGRFSIFLVPSLLVLVARGAEALVTWSRRPLLVSAGLAIFLVSSPLALAGYHVLEPPARQDMRPLLMHLVENWRNGDSLYVYRRSQYALRYYSTCEDCTPRSEDLPWPTRLARLTRDNIDPPALESVSPTVVVGSREISNDPLMELKRLPVRGRSWLLFSHVGIHKGVDDERALVAEIERDRELLEFVRARGARLYLFGPPEPSGSG